jgi:hypothetical protein
VARDPYARDLAALDPGFVQGLVDGALATFPDPIHVLFDPAGVGALLDVVDGALAPLAPLLVEDDRFGDRQPAIYAEQVRTHDLSSAVALTVFSHRPVSPNSRMASATIRIEFSQVSIVVPAMCGAKVTFPSSSQGLPSGKGSSS